MTEDEQVPTSVSFALSWLEDLVARLEGEDDGSVMIAYALLLVMPVIFLATLAGAALSAVS